jgi:hypothetical protein
MYMYCLQGGRTDSYTVFAVHESIQFHHRHDRSSGSIQLNHLFYVFHCVKNIGLCVRMCVFVCVCTRACVMQTFRRLVSGSIGQGHALVKLD